MQVRSAAGPAAEGMRALGWAAWLVVGFGLAVAVVGPSVWSPDGATAVTVTTRSLFFVVLILRIGCAAVVHRGRRPAMIVLVVSILLFGAGSTALNADGHPDLTRFPAPGEGLFLASYLALAGYLLIDTARRSTTAVATWLEAAVICGGVGCLAGGLLLTPVAAAFGENGLPLLVALLYPLIDLALGLLVVGQVVLRVRPRSKQTAALCAAFACFALADSSFVLNLASGRYYFSTLNDLTWATGFTLLVAAACRPRADVLPQRPREQGSSVMVAASAVAIVVLASRPGSGLGPYLTIPAVLTLVAAGGRLVLALREAHGAAEAFQLSRTDDLTMLPNRRAVLATLDEALSSDRPVALMILDLDGFKDINDTLGHAAGDAMLELAARRMRQALPADVLVARLGGDEFALVSADSDPLVAVEMAQFIRGVLLQPTLIDGIELVTHASIGIAVRSSADDVSTDLLRRADIAMYQAKLTRAGALLYDSGHDDFSRQKLQLAEDLRKGIDDGQLVVWYQPQIDAETEEVCGLEALVRWQHPEQGLLQPVSFLPAARRAGLMLSLSEVVSRLVVADAKHWYDQGLNLRVALNCAPPELLSGILLPRLFDAVRAANLPPDSLVIEVTEDSFITDPERARGMLEEIREHRLQVSVDDYGTGFSSLSYLKDLPVHELKMDRSFVAALRTDQRSRMIVASTSQMAHALGLRLVAEGVEDEATAAELAAMGIDVLQGYHIARPMPANEVEGWVRRWSTQNAVGLRAVPVAGAS